MRTGDAYVASLRDGRAVFLDGERVKDVTDHPAFAEPIRRIAETYGRAHAAGTDPSLTFADALVAATERFPLVTSGVARPHPQFICTRGMVSVGRAVSGGHGDLQGAGAPGPRPITAVLSPTPLCPSYALY